MGPSRAPQRPAEPLHEEEQICPLCINELDETERAWLPCSCGYQLCLFCYDRLKTEFSNQCPNCRLPYDSDFQAGLRRRQERVAQLQREEAAQREAASRTAAVASSERGGAGGGAGAGSKHVQPPPPPPPPRGPRSPRRDLHIEEEQLWPSLGASAAASSAASHHPPPPPPPHLHTSTSQWQQQAEAAGARRLGSPLRLAAILSQPAVAEAEASSSSSADTAATTPQSPASSVVCFRAAPSLSAAAAAACSPSAMCCGKPAAPAVQGRCAVVLQRGGGLGVDVDPEGASLAASLQEAVRAGSLSVKQAAASLASYLRQRQQAAAASSSASSSPARSGRQPSSAGSSGMGGGLGVTPFSMAPPSLLPNASSGGPAAVAAAAGGMLSMEPTLSVSDSQLSVATSASLSHWAPGSSAISPSSSMHMGGLFGMWQHQQQQHAEAQPAAALVGSPVRDNDKLPLFMRRGSLPAASAAAAAAAAAAASQRGSGFPGFPAGSGGSTLELKRMIAPPPGFAAPAFGPPHRQLPRFQ